MRTILKSVFFLLPVFYMSLNIYAQNPAETKPEIQWMTFEEAVARNKKEPRKLIIDVYTHWCGWCKHMDATTYMDKELISYINNKYYAVKLDAEQKEPVTFNGRKFIYKSEYKTHELALSLLNNKMGYPTTIFMDESFAILTPMAGFIDAKTLKPMLRFFGENTYKTQTWEEYQKNPKETASPSSPH